MIARRLQAAFPALILAALLAAPAHAGIFSRDKKQDAKTPSADAVATAVQKAIVEQRLVDAERLLTQAALAGLKDARLSVLEGDVDLARGRWSDGLEAFRRAETDPGDRTGAMPGEGVALSGLHRSSEAVNVLEHAVAQEPNSWHAWNALAGEYDDRRDWVRSEQAYDHAIANSDGSPVVLNNRGYSRLLQRRIDEAIPDFVEALRRKPDFAEARTNLRLAMAMKGDYDRAIAGGSPGDEAAILNNAGFAAAMRGDYDRAEVLLQEAMAKKGVYYDRASENLKVVEGLKSAQSHGQTAAQPQGKPASDAPH